MRRCSARDGDDAAVTSCWRRVGVLRRRPETTTRAPDLQLSWRAASDDDDDDGDGAAPLLLYDATASDDDDNDDDKKRATTGGGRGGRGVCATLTGCAVPRYLARRVRVPAPHAPSSGMRVVSVADDGSDDADSAACASPPPPRDVAEVTAAVLRAEQQRRQRRRRRSRLLLVTTQPNVSQLSLLVPAVLFLLDIAIFITSMALTHTARWLVIAYCVLIPAPDIIALILIFKKNLYSTTIALHMLLWTTVVMFYLLLYSLLLLVAHVALMLVLTLYTVRMRQSFYSTTYTLT